MDSLSITTSWCGACRNELEHSRAPRLTRRPYVKRAAAMVELLSDLAAVISRARPRRRPGDPLHQTPGRGEYAAIISTSRLWARSLQVATPTG